VAADTSISAGTLIDRRISRSALNEDAIALLRRQFFLCNMQRHDGGSFRGSRARKRRTACENDNLTRIVLAIINQATGSEQATYITAPTPGRMQSYRASRFSPRGRERFHRNTVVGDVDRNLSNRRVIPEDPDPRWGGCNCRRHSGEIRPENVPIFRSRFAEQSHRLIKSPEPFGRIIRITSDITQLTHIIYVRETRQARVFGALISDDNGSARWNARRAR